MYVRGPQHSITGGGSPPPPQYIQVGGGKYPPTLPGSTPMIACQGDSLIAVIFCAVMSSLMSQILR